MNIFASRNFRFLYGITVLSAVNSAIYIFIIPLVLYDLTKSSIAMSTMRLMEFLPNVFLGMLVGVIVDRMNRNIMIIYGGFVRFILSLFLLYSISAEGSHVWQLYLIGFLLATVGYTVGNASNAITPQLFDKSWMTEIQSKFSLVHTISSVIGPSIAGGLLIWLSYDHFIWIYVLCMGFSWLFAYRIDKTETPKRNMQQSIWADMKEGIRELVGNKNLFMPTLAILFSNFATSLIIGVMTFYVLDVLGNTKEQLGIMYSISAIGGIVGAKVMRPLQKKFRRGQIYCILPLIDIFVLIIFFFTQTWWLLGILLGYRTCSSIMTNIIFSAVRQEQTPNHLLGRVAGTSSMLAKLVVPAGLLAGGIWAEMLPIPYIFLVASLVVFITYVLLRRSPFSEII
ncbi:MAG TPA: MFS transporter [Ureibacillus sp.]|nr:MFS transporter [Ureibacillus sp.]